MRFWKYLFFVLLHSIFQRLCTRMLLLRFGRQHPVVRLQSAYPSGCRMFADKGCCCQRTEPCIFQMVRQFQQGIFIIPVAVYDYRNNGCLLPFYPLQTLHCRFCNTVPRIPERRRWLHLPVLLSGWAGGPVS